MKYELGDVQKQFAEIIWEKEPIASGELVKICDKEFGWKKSTTYTVLKKLCEKGIFQNVDGIVTSVISKMEFYAVTSDLKRPVTIGFEIEDGAPDESRDGMLKWATITISTPSAIRCLNG